VIGNPALRADPANVTRGFWRKRPWLFLGCRAPSAVRGSPCAVRASSARSSLVRPVPALRAIRPASRHPRPSAREPDPAPRHRSDRLPSSGPADCARLNSEGNRPRDAYPSSCSHGGHLIRLSDSVTQSGKLGCQRRRAGPAALNRSATLGPYSSSSPRFHRLPGRARAARHKWLPAVQS